MKPANRLRLYGLLLVLSIAAMGVLYECTKRAQAEQGIVSIRDYPQIQAEGILRILATYEDFKTSELEPNAQSEALGLANHIGELSGLTINVLLEDNADKALEMLRLQQVDVIAQPIVRTAGIDTTQFVWINDMTTGPVYLVQRRDSLLIDKQLYLAGKTVHLPKGSPLGLFIQHLSEEIGDSIYIAEDPIYNTEQIVMQVASGGIAYTLCSEHEARHYRRLYPDLDISLPVSYSLRRGWLVRRSSPILADSISHWLLRIGSAQPHR